MSVEYTREMGDYLGRTYELTVRAAPSLNRVSDFAVVLHYELDETQVQIARIDSSHSQVHFDRLYRRDRPKGLLDVDVWEAAELLESNWRRYARSYERAHGGSE